MKNQAVAHILEEEEQSIKDHLENVARKAAEFSRDFELPGIDAGLYAYETGLVHDIGKYSDKFQMRIRGRNDISVDHATAGARELYKQKMLAASLAVAGHHGGLPNGRDCTEANLFNRVNKKEIENYDAYQSEIKLEAVKEPKVSMFEEAFFARMIFSSLVDADFLDTENFMQRGEVERGGYDTIDILHKRMMDYIEPWTNITNETPALNRIRTDILLQCLEKGSGNQGLYSLTVPTGGGKTISSLAFALEHAKKHGMKRIIYVIPYTSIIEQNAGVFKNILGEKNVLEHHSNALLSKENDKQEYLQLHQLSAENWDAPVIVTTNVQFFESFYFNKVSKCRKLHNVADSVVIFDEAQMIPLKYLKPCVKAIQTLVNSYHVTAVLCTATQPALEKWFLPLEVQEICTDYQSLFRELKRTTIRNYGSVSREKLDEKIQQEEQILVIVNKKRTAQDLCRQLPEEDTFHLSTYMTPMHRRQVIEQIRKRLKAGKKCRVISTSLVEAGVDLDFPIVFREKAGLDSIIQAAGRCNREGKRPPEESLVWVYELEDEKFSLLEKNISILNETVEKYELYDDVEAIHYYFSTLQNLDESYLDQEKIIEGFEKGMDGIYLPFKEVDKKFHLIDSDTKTVMIPLESEAASLLDLLEYQIAQGENFRHLLRKLSAYSINLYEQEYDELLENGSIYEMAEGIAVLQDMTLYTERMGLCSDTKNTCLIF